MLHNCDLVFQCAFRNCIYHLFVKQFLYIADYYIVALVFIKKHTNRPTYLDLNWFAAYPSKHPLSYIFSPYTLYISSLIDDTCTRAFRINTTGRENVERRRNDH